MFSSYGNDDPDFSSKWEEICNGCSVSFMQLIIEQNGKRLGDLTSQIEEKETLLNSSLTQADFDIFKKDLEKSSLAWEKEIKNLKFKKNVNVIF